ncbi:ATP-dependent helicase, partial [bacterium]|nr:ATP-dependent helicase [bacterium]
MATAKKAIKPTPEQSAVVDCDHGLISLRGFHGTGKTGTQCAFIVERLARNRDTRVLGLSLTKQAAWNLRKRLITHPKWSPAFERRVTVGTFHSFGYRYVRRFAALIGFTANFDINNGINEKLLKELIVHKKYAGLKAPLKTLTKANRNHVRSGDSIPEIAQRVTGNDVDAALIAETVRKLKQRKHSLDVMDFDDLLYQFYRLLRNGQVVMDAVLADYNQLVADEFQDVTQIQWR